MQNNVTLDDFLEKKVRIKANWESIKKLSHDLSVPLDYINFDNNILKAIGAYNDEEALYTVWENTAKDFSFEQILECYMRNVLLCVLFSKWLENKKSFYIDGKNKPVTAKYIEWKLSDNKLSCSLSTDEFSFHIIAHANVSDLSIKDIPNYLFSVTLVNKRHAYKMEDTAKLSDITQKYIEDMYW